LANIQFKILLKQTVISAVLSFLTFGFGFVRVSFFSKRMPMEDFGILSLLLGYSAFLIYVFTLGSYQYLFKRVNDGEEAKRSGLWSALGLTVLISFAGTTIAFFFSGSICEFLNISNYKTDFRLAILATATTSIMVIFLFYHYGLGRNNFQNLLQFLRSSLWVIIVILISFFFNLTLTQILIIFNLAIFGILLISIPWKELPAFSFKEISFWPVIRYCVPLLPYFAGVWGLSAIIRTQLNIDSGPRNVALFNVAYTLMEIIFMFISTITATLSPYFFAEGEQESKYPLLYNVMLKYSILLVVLILPFIYITRFDIILLLTSDKYLSAGSYIPLLIFLPLLRVLIIVFEQVYLKESKTIFLGTIYGIGILLALLLSMVLIPKYSIPGAIYSSLGVYFFLFICLCLKQYQKVNYAYQNLSAIFSLTIIMWASVFIMEKVHFNSFFKTLPLALVTGISLFSLPVFNTREKQKLLSILKIKYDPK
jgi:O-antigen/teichoic acid export membrane protein